MAFLDRCSISQVLNVTPHRKCWMIFRMGSAIVAIVAFALIAEGCATGRDQSRGPGSVEDYLAQGQNDGYGYNLYDQCALGYDPYWERWCPAPIYYYPYYGRGDGDNDCDDGNCGERNDGHGRRREPESDSRTATISSRTALHSTPVVPHGSSAPTIVSTPSGGSETTGGFGRGGGFSGEGGMGRSGFGGTRGGGRR
jgi:hypothetical protein